MRNSVLLSESGSIFRLSRQRGLEVGLELGGLEDAIQMAGAGNGSHRPIRTDGLKGGHVQAAARVVFPDDESYGCLDVLHVLPRHGQLRDPVPGTKSLHKKARDFVQWDPILRNRACCTRASC